MNYGEYHHSLDSFDRENFEKIIRDSRRFPEVSPKHGRQNMLTYEYPEDEYKVKSKMSAVQSRVKLPILSIMEEILLRFYGSFALRLNENIRFSNEKKTLFKSNTRIEKSKKYTKKFIDNFKINTHNNISLLEPKDISDFLEMEKGRYAISLTNDINQLINKHNSEHIDADYFYRISRAKKNVYVTQEEVEKLSLNTKNRVKLGDIVMDKAITSVGHDLQSILYRYSYKGKNATHKHNTIKDFEDKEEILYVIKNNEKLNYMDIAGFKLNRPEISDQGRKISIGLFNKDQDHLSSGELIIPSHTPFRVTGIQKMDRTMNRRVVFLEPMKLEDINEKDIVQNNFNGEPFSGKRILNFFRKINFDLKYFTA